MLKTFLKIAFRTLLAQRLFSFINIAGLAVGIACAVLIFLFVRDETGYDRQWRDGERVYRVSRDWYATGRQQPMSLAAGPPQVAPLLKADFPEIEAAARLYGGQAILRLEELAFYEDDIRFADPEIFDIFNFEWLRGDPATAINDPFTIVLTESVARRYFGDQDPLDRTLMLENVVPMRVTGVIRDLPSNTHLRADVIASLGTVPPVLGEHELRNWGSNNYHTYIRLRPSARIEDIESQLPAFANRHMSENASASTGYSAMPVADIHLHSKRQYELSPPGSILTVLVFSAVAICILVVACFNFMNLSTARSMQRGKEIGVRKSVGARKSQIFAQFMGESLLVALLAGLCALVLVELMLPLFNNFTGKAMSFNLLEDGRLQLGMLGLTLFVGFFAGSYPSLYLARLKASRILKGELASGRGGQALRNLLVLMQFSVAIALVAATLTVVAQMRYAQDISLGLNKERVLILGGSPTGGLGEQWETFKQELLRHPEITHASASNLIPFEANTNGTFFRPEGADSRNVPNMMVELDFFETYGIGLLAGRFFSRDFPADRIRREQESEAGLGNVVVNRSLVEIYGWTPAEAVGKAVRFGFDGGPVEGVIVGVVEDSFFESLRSEVKPMLFMLPTAARANGAPSVTDASVRITGNDIQGTLDYIDGKWSEFLPQFPLNRHFLSEEFDLLFQAETRQGELFSYFAALAILIACLGLYGLAVFNTQRRTKEIGVRKVLGGSVWSIVLLLTNDFSKLVLLANVIAWPVAWFAMDRWLSNFAYRIDLTPLIFIGSGLIALCVAWVTVGGTAARAANAKPVLALRYE